MSKSKNSKVEKLVTVHRKDGTTFQRRQKVNATKTPATAATPSSNPKTAKVHSSEVSSSSNASGSVDAALNRYTALKKNEQTPFRATPETPCVAAWENNYYDDSDFAGMFLTPDGQWVIQITGSTRHAGGFIPQVQATQEIRDAYKTYYEEEKAKFLQEISENEKRVIKVGSIVRVNRPRAKSHGISGKVIWRGKDQYSRAYSEDYAKYRVGIRDDEGETTFVPESYLEVNVSEGEWREPVSERSITNLSTIWARNHPAPPRN